MTTDIQPTKGVYQRAVRDAERDTTLAKDALEAADAQALHKMCARLLQDRTELAQGIDAVTRSFLVLGEPRSQDGIQREAIQAVERIAQESMSFAREVFRLIYQPKPEQEPPADR